MKLPPYRSWEKELENSFRFSFNQLNFDDYSLGKSKNYMRYLNEEEVEFLEGETNLIGVSFRDSESSFLEVYRLENRLLGGCDFSRSFLRNFFFSRSNLHSSSFRWANLYSVDFSGCDLTEADFRGASMSGCIFKGANLKGALFEGSFLNRRGHADYCGGNSFEGAIMPLQEKVPERGSFTAYTVTTSGVIEVEVPEGSGRVCNLKGEVLVEFLVVKKGEGRSTSDLDYDRFGYPCPIIFREGCTVYSKRKWLPVALTRRQACHWLHKTREFYFAKPYPLDFPFSYGDWEVWTRFSKKPWSERDKGSTDYS